MAKFAAPRTAEQRLGVQLRKVARIVGGIVDAHTSGDKIIDPVDMRRALEAYSKALGPWSEAVTGKILQSVSASNAKAWESMSRKIGREINSAFTESIVGAVAKDLQREQVALIKSLPIEAGIRAQDIAQQATMGGKRADVAAAEIKATGSVTESRATLIARTEIAKANSTFNTARALSVGCTHYYWRTADDGDVRPSHKALDGNIYRFDDPPEIEGEGRHGPGEFPNCRCYAEPIIDN